MGKGKDRQMTGIESTSQKKEAGKAIQCINIKSNEKTIDLKIYFKTNNRLSAWGKYG